MKSESFIDSNATTTDASTSSKDIVKRTNPYDLNYLVQILLKDTALYYEHTEFRILSALYVGRLDCVSITRCLVLKVTCF